MIKKNVATEVLSHYFYVSIKVYRTMTRFPFKM